MLGSDFCGMSLDFMCRDFCKMRGTTKSEKRDKAHQRKEAFTRPIQPHFLAPRRAHVGGFSWLNEKRRKHRIDVPANLSRLVVPHNQTT
jgi:hypothetical protein